MDSTSVVRHSLNPIEGVRYVRVEPKTWNTTISFRAAVYGTVQPGMRTFTLLCLNYLAKGH